MSKVWAFNIGDKVQLVTSGESGEVIGRSEYKVDPDSYYVEYKAADGRQTTCWWNYTQIKADSLGC